MKLSYYPSTDSLYIELSSKPGADTVAVGNAVVDVDEDGEPVGIDINSEASKVVDLSRIRLVRISEEAQTLGPHAEKTVGEITGGG